MSLRQNVTGKNVTGQNATETKCHMTKCYSAKVTQKRWQTKCCRTKSLFVTSHAGSMREDLRVGHNRNITAHIHMFRGIFGQPRTYGGGRLKISILVGRPLWMTKLNSAPEQYNFFWPLLTYGIIWFNHSVSRSRWITPLRPSYACTSLEIS